MLYFFFEKLFKEYQMQVKARRPEHYWDVVQYSFAIFSYVRSAETVDVYARFLPYLLAYSVGGMYSMVLKWVESDMDIPSAMLIEKLKNGFTSPDF